MGAADEIRESTQRVASAVAPSIVRIGRHGGRGCGVVVGDGLVVTNSHNLRDRTTEVTFADGRSVQGSAAGIDSDGDLAVLQVDTGGAAALTWRDQPAELGEAVFAVARIPDGPRVTFGTVSAVDRSFRGPRGRLIAGGLEHTAPMARGTSGSPIVDGEGRLVGLTTVRLGDGFSIAVAADADLRRRVDDLGSGRVPRRRVLGAAVAPAHITRRLRRAVGLPDRDGVLVRQVENGSPAAEAGLRSGDLLTAAAGRDVSDTDDLYEILSDVPAGGSLQVHVVRGTDEIDLLVQFRDGDAEDAGQA